MYMMDESVLGQDAMKNAFWEKTMPLRNRLNTKDASCESDKINQQYGTAYQSATQRIDSCCLSFDDAFFERVRASALKSQTDANNFVNEELKRRIDKCLTPLYKIFDKVRSVCP